MGSVWKRLQRVNKRAAKFQFTASYHELRLETTAKWRPSNLSVVWTRRSRRVASAPLPWEPDMVNPLVGAISWPVPDNHAISVTLFKDPRTHELEDKDWTFVIEDITPLGKKRVLASASINMRKYASIESTQQSFALTLKPVSRKITAANLELTISCVFLREGKATDEDMQSVVSLMSVNNNCDVAPLDDLEDIPDLESTGDISDHLFDFTQQLEQMTTSLNGCIDLPTPLSVPSLSEDPTPLAEFNHLNFEYDNSADKHAIGGSSSGCSGDDGGIGGGAGSGTNDESSSSLKTPSAHQHQQQLQILKPAQSQQKQLQHHELVEKLDDIVAKREKESQNKIVTSTPIAKTAAAVTDKKLLDSTSKSTKTPSNESVVSHAATGLRKFLNFSGSNSTKQHNGGGGEAGANAGAATGAAGDNTMRKEIVTEMPPTERLFDQQGDIEFTEKSFSKISPNTNTPKATNIDENHKSGGGSNNSNNTNKRAELQPLNLKKNYEHEIKNNVNMTTLISRLSQSSVNNGSATTTAATDTTTTTTGVDSGTGTTTHSTILNTSTNSNNTNNSMLNHIKPMERSILKEHTPGQDLLEWCKEMTKDYPNVKVTNLTTSWRNGMAFCAIIHHFEPSLIDMSKLSAHDVVGNCRTAFDAAETLGIPRVIEPRDMSFLAVPDKLAVMTYLHQMREHFTGKQLQIEQIGSTSDESSYVIGNYKTDNLSHNLLNLSHLKAQLLHQNSLDDDIFGVGTNDKLQLSPTAKKDVKNLILSGSKSILGKVLSPTKDKNTINASQHSNLSMGNQTPPPPPSATDATETMSGGGGGVGSTIQYETETTNQQTQDVYNSQLVAPSSPTSLDPNTANRILSRHKEMSEKAKMMMEKLKISTNVGVDKNENDEERQQRLREQARRLILETRTKTTNGGALPHQNHHYHHQNSMDSPTTPTKLKRMNFSPERTISPIHNGFVDDYMPGDIGSGSGSGSPKVPLSPTKKITPPRDLDNTSATTTSTTTTTTMVTSSNKLSPSHRLSERFNSNSPLQSFNAVMDRISPKNEKKGDKLSYIESELEALEREQEAIDQKASSLEKKLRAVMGGNPKSEETEEQLLSQWFTLVNKKNALLRRQMQLNILEQESDLERKYTMLNQELRAAQSVEDWRKTEAQREKERLLLEELVAIVDKRDQLVQHLHSQEIAIEDDHEIARELEQVDISGAKEKCVIQ